MFSANSPSAPGIAVGELDNRTPRTSSRFDAGSVLTSNTFRPCWAIDTDAAHASDVLPTPPLPVKKRMRSEEHTSELQSPCNLVYRLLLEKRRLSCRTFCTWTREGAPPPLTPLCRPRPCVRLRSSPWLCVRAPAGPPPGAHGLFFNDPATTEIYTLSLHDALPI